ncbi:hypothetical protein F5Y16DRAFT_415745 [Xylariaceae sp. FL0255]|nr:hypothetical protein F5Y16DRAFT_415745 [Xylariaceae sp. FL0255]
MTKSTSTTNNTTTTNTIPPWINPDLSRLLKVYYPTPPTSSPSPPSSSSSSTTTDPNFYRTWAESLVDLPPGAIFARINGVTTNPNASSNSGSNSRTSSYSYSGCKPTYSSIQIGPHPTSHVELNSDLVYINHSCNPTLELDTSRMEFRVSSCGNRGLRKGDELTFFYPSSEWDMAQAFDCWCDAGKGGVESRNGENGNINNTTERNGAEKKKCFGRIDGAANMDIKRLRDYFLNAHIEELLAKREAEEMEMGTTARNGDGSGDGYEEWK